jgi:thiol-disulfide isomerase/thioredoxin
MSSNKKAITVRRARMRRVFYLVTGGLLALSVAAGVFVSLQAGKGAGVRRGGLFGNMPAEKDADSDPAQAVLAKAALSVGFHPTMDSSVGTIENLAADAVHPSGSSLLLPVGATAPDFSLLTPTDERESLSNYRGKVVFLEFFATWCPHCQAEAQHIVAIRQATSTKFVFLSVNADSEDAASVYAFDRYFAVTYPTLLDPGRVAGSFNSKGSAGPVTQAYQVRIYPTFYIIDKEGKVAWRSEGEQPDALLIRELQETAKK